MGKTVAAGNVAAAVRLRLAVDTSLLAARLP